MPVHYSPGTHPVAVTPQGVAVLAEDTSPALAARIHALLADGRGLGGVLEALTGAYGTSLSAVPPFAVALAESGAVRLAVRGAFVLDVTAGAAERVSGEGVTTWTERVISDVSRVELTPADSAPPELPIADGVVLAASLTWVPSADGPQVAPAAVAAGAPEPEPGEEAPVPEPEPVQEAPVPESDEPEPEPAPERPAAASAPAPRVAVVPPPAPKPEPVAPAPLPGLIDSAAVLSVADTLLPAESTLIPAAEHEEERATDAVASEAEPAEPVDATVVREVGPPPAMLGDHDGETISVAEARAMRTGDSVPPPLAPPRPPAPGRVRMSTGPVILLDRTVVIGRRPRSTRVSGTDLPHLVAVDSPQQDISRSHVELRVEGDSIVATDLHTTNGTTLLRSGVDPMRLHPGEGTVVVPGDVIDLGDGITATIEDIA